MIKFRTEDELLLLYIACKLSKDFEKVRYTPLCLKRITNKNLLCGAGKSALLCGSLGGRVVWGRMDTCINVRLSPFIVHLKLSQHC